METERIIQLEATIGDVRFHNSKQDDNSWCDITVRAMGEANILAASNMSRAKFKLVKVIYEIE